MTSHGKLELTIIHAKTADGEETHVLQLDVEADHEDLKDLVKRLSPVIEQWLVDHEIVIVEGVGPDGTKYGGRPN